MLAQVLRRLLESAAPLTASCFSTAQRQALDRFARDTRLLEITQQGRRTVYRLIDRKRAAATSVPDATAKKATAAMRAITC